MRRKGDDLHVTQFQSVQYWGCLVQYRAEVPKLGRSPHLSEEGERQSRPAPHIVWCFVSRAPSQPLLSLDARMNIIKDFRGRKRGSLSSSWSPIMMFCSSSISHLCAFAFDSAAFFSRSASDICGFVCEPDDIGVAEALNDVSAS